LQPKTVLRSSGDRKDATKVPADPDRVESDDLTVARFDERAAGQSVGGPFVLASRQRKHSVSKIVRFMHLHASADAA